MKNAAEAVAVAKGIGYPVMIKASGGGGGKGMRIAWDDEEAALGFRLATDEAKTAFKDDRLFVEKFIDHGRHIEIQLVADNAGNIVYFPERECSIQRRNQKVIEESPSTLLNPAVRKAMGEQAAALARTVGYRSAGTCEFIADQNANFYFLEMNTRLQVEHPITEYITGVDLVEQMIRVGAGLNLSVKQEDIKINGHATECRVYAEDPYKNFLPSIGRLTRYVEPMQGHPNVRCDSGLYEGLEISMYYDPMICKLITYGKTRDESLQYMRKALDSYIIRGVRHNVAFLRSVIDHPRYIAGKLATAFIAEEWAEGFKGANMTAVEINELIASASVMHYKRTMRDSCCDVPADEFIMKIQGKEHEVKIVAKSEDTFDVTVDNTLLSTVAKWDVDTILLNGTVNGKDVVCHYVQGLAAGLRVQQIGTEFDVTILSKKQKKLWNFLPEKVMMDTSKMVLSPMPGRVTSVSVKPGDKVDIGDEVCCLEAMKMSNILRSEAKGTVKKVNTKAGDNVQTDDLLIEF
jgi:propionyl-CoA carboxylase alpha chain